MTNQPDPTSGPLPVTVMSYQENTSLKRIGVVLYAVGHGRDPHEALAAYEADATSFELEAGTEGFRRVLCRETERAVGGRGQAYAFRA